MVQILIYWTEQDRALLDATKESGLEYMQRKLSIYLCLVKNYRKNYNIKMGIIAFILWEV
jgi:hypothetical protein